MRSIQLSPTHLMLALLVVVTWGCNFVVAKQVLSHFSTFQTLTLRFLMLLPLLLIFRKPPLPMPILLRITAIFSIGHLGCMFGSMYVGLDASLAAILQQLGIPIALVLSTLLLNEKMDKRGVSGIIVAVAGTVVLAGMPNAIREPLGVLLILLSAIFWAAYSVELRRVQTQPNPVALMVWINVLALPVYLPVTLLLESEIAGAISTATALDWLLLAYLAFIGSIVAHSVWYYLLRHNPVGQVVPFLLLAPLCGSVAAVTFLHDPVTLRLIIGGGIMLTGVGIVIFRKAEVVAAGEE